MNGSAEHFLPTEDRAYSTTGIFSDLSIQVSQYDDYSGEPDEDAAYLFAPLAPTVMEESVQRASVRGSVGQALAQVRAALQPAPKQQAAGNI